MQKFPEAVLRRLYEVDGYEGFCRRVGYTEAKNNPLAFRATIGSKLYWFVELVADDVTGYEESRESTFPET